mmetsp:Transcript_13853/g.39819  ORF Transcript_13853/g.39819 Transcript_13853/m.39819 type:complete len:400 (-) Transcript_13853:263-1462(-)
MSAGFEDPFSSLPAAVIGHILGLGDARTVCMCASASATLAAAVEEADAPIFASLVQRRYGHLEGWAIPAAALAPPPHDPCGWRALYYRLADRRSDGFWGRIAVGNVTHEALVARGLVRPTRPAARGCVLLIDDAIYDVTAFAPLHPGMAASLHLFSGSDATEPFHDVAHSAEALRIMRSFLVPGLRLPHEGVPASLLSDADYSALFAAPRRAATTWGAVPRLVVPDWGAAPWAATWVGTPWATTWGDSAPWSDITPWAGVRPGKGWGGGIGALVGSTAAAKGATAELRQRLAAELSAPNELAARWLSRGAKPLVPFAARLALLGSSVLQMLRPPADGSAGHRRHHALFEAGLYSCSPREEAEDDPADETHWGDNFDAAAARVAALLWPHAVGGEAAGAP